MKHDVSRCRHVRCGDAIGLVRTRNKEPHACPKQPTAVVQMMLEMDRGLAVDEASRTAGLDQSGLDQSVVLILPRLPPSASDVPIPAVRDDPSDLLLRTLSGLCPSCLDGPFCWLYRILTSQGLPRSRIGRQQISELPVGNSDSRSFVTGVYVGSNEQGGSLARSGLAVHRNHTGG